MDTSKSLLGLPAEILQHVLYLLDPSSFYLCLLTNKIFRQHALQSKRLLLHHLDQIPGKRGFPHRVLKDAALLLSVFGKRAAKQLSHGASRMANTHVWETYLSLDRNLSDIVPWYDNTVCKECVQTTSNIGRVTSKSSERSAILEVHAAARSLKIHDSGQSLRNNERPRKSYLISSRFLSNLLSTHDQNILEDHRIVQIAWKGSCRGRQCASTPTLAVLLSRPFLAGMVCVIISVDPDFGPIIQANYDIEAPSDANEVAALAIDPEGDLTIIWQCQHWEYKLVRYNPMTFDGLHYLAQTNEMVLPSHNIVPHRIKKVCIHGDRILLYTRLFQMPFWIGTMPLKPDESFQNTFSREETSLPADSQTVITSRQGIYLGQRHLHKVRGPDLIDGEPTCVNAVLKLFISRDKHHTTLTAARQGVYVVRMYEDSDSCKFFDPYASNGSSQYLFVARLTDTPSLDNLPTIGLKTAVSPRGYRVALAAWRTLKIYAINPEAFLIPKYAPRHSTKVHGFMVSNYNRRMKRLGLEFFSNRPREANYVLLEPVDIQNTGVIHALHWISEDELWALTDEGICQWNFGVLANGQRTKSPVENFAGDLNLARGRRSEA